MRKQIFFEDGTQKAECILHSAFCRKGPLFNDQLLDAVLLVELINTAAGVDQLLLAGVEGVALGADFNGDVLLGGAGLDDVAAGASDGGLLVIGMDSFLHCVKLLIICCHDCAAQGIVTRRDKYSITAL